MSTTSNTNGIHPAIGPAVAQITKSLTPEARRAVEQLAASPEARAACERADADGLERRHALRLELDVGIDRRYGKDVNRLAAARDKAAARLARANEEQAAARDENAAALGALAGLSVRVMSEQARVEAELRATADPRLSELDEQLVMLFDQARHLVQSSQWIEGRDVWGRPIRKHESNAVEVGAAMDELTAARRELAALALQPVPRDEVTQHLTDISLRVAAMLAPFNLDAPRIDERTGAVISEATHKAITKASDGNPA